MMFAPFCPTHDTNVLMTRRNVLSFWNGPDGPVIRWKCSCGHEGIMNADGSTADPVETPAATPAQISTEIPTEIPTEVAAHATSATPAGSSVSTLVDDTVRVDVDAVACCV